MKNVTDDYVNMVAAFECDFAIAKVICEDEALDHLVVCLPKNVKLSKDIELLKKLSHGLRYGTLKIMEVN